jgi:hypothetical protein
MRRSILLIVAGGVLAAAAALAGCPAAHSDYPGKSCMLDSDCYTDELCDKTTQTCVPNQDMTIIGDFAHPPLDFANSDGIPPDDLTPGDM